MTRRTSHNMLPSSWRRPPCSLSRWSHTSGKQWQCCQIKRAGAGWLLSIILHAALLHIVARLVNNN
eukprot:11222041-Lingulodinium_polyedra.AAC.1